MAERSLIRHKSTIGTRKDISLHATASFLLHCALRLELGPSASICQVHACGLEGTGLQYGVVVEAIITQPDGAGSYVHTFSDFTMSQLRRRFNTLVQAKIPLRGNVRSLEDLLDPENGELGQLPPHCMQLLQATNQSSYLTWELTVPSELVDESRPDAEQTFLTLRHESFPPFSDDSSFNNTLFDISLVEQGESHQLWLRPSVPPTGFKNLVDQKLCQTISRSMNVFPHVGGVPTADSIGKIALKMTAQVDQKALVNEEEARFSSKVIACAAAIQKAGARMVFLAGPSASGKTSVANRIALALRALGYTPCIMCLDDYYRSPFEPTYPKSADGEPNHECVEALRVDRFQQDLRRISQGQRVQTPRYDFKNKCIIEDGGPVISLGSRPVVITEGLFALSPKLTPDIPREEKFNVFVMPIALILDEFHRPSGIDLSLLRRVHRDYSTRNRTASYTIQRAGAVALGSTESILPTLPFADFFLNSSLAHELWMLQQATAPLLRRVMPTDRYEWTAAQQLLQRYLAPPVDGCPPALLPQSSVLQEFFGFQYEEGLLRPKSRGENSSSSFGAKWNPEPITLDSNGNSAITSSNGQGVATPPTSPGSTPGCAVVELLPRLRGNGAMYGSPVVAVNVNGVIRSVNDVIFPVPKQIIAEPVYRHSRLGLELIAETARAVCFAAAKLSFPKRTLIFEHSFFTEGTAAATGLFCRWQEFMDVSHPENLSSLEIAEAASISDKMTELIHAKTEIRMFRTTTADAAARFDKQGMSMAAALVRSMEYPEVKVDEVAGVLVLHSTSLPLAADAGAIGAFHFSALPTLGGFRLALDTNTNPSDPPVIQVEEPQGIANEAGLKRYLEFRTSLLLAHNEIRCLGDLNTVLAQHKANAHHIRNLGDVLHMTACRRIAERVIMNGVRLVSVAGAEGAGKRSFVRDLRRALRSFGVQCVSLSMDDYRRDVEDRSYPVTLDGLKDHRHPDAYHLDDLQDDVSALLKQQPVNAPQYDNAKGMRKVGVTTPIAPLPGSVVIVEGVLALQQAACPVDDDVIKPATERLRILIHPMPSIQLDELHPVSVTVLRRLRKIHRDHTLGDIPTSETLLNGFQSAQQELSACLENIPLADEFVFSAEIGEVNTLMVECASQLKSVSLVEDGLEVYTTAQRLRAYLRWFQALDRRGQ